MKIYICPKCGAIAEKNAYYGRITCTSCDWEGYDETMKMTNKDYFVEEKLNGKVPFMRIGFDDDIRYEKTVLLTVDYPTYFICKPHRDWENYKWFCMSMAYSNRILATRVPKEVLVGCLSGFWSIRDMVTRLGDDTEIYEISADYPYAKLVEDISTCVGLPPTGEFIDDDWRTEYNLDEYIKQLKEEIENEPCDVLDDIGTEDIATENKVEILMESSRRFDVTTAAKTAKEFNDIIANIIDSGNPFMTIDDEYTINVLDICEIRFIEVNEQ